MTFRREHFYKKPADPSFSLCVVCGFPEAVAHHWKFPPDYFPMDSAPKDGTTVFLLLRDKSRRLGVWQQDLSGESCPPFAEWFYRCGAKRETLRPLNEEPFAWKPFPEASDASDDELQGG